MARRTYTTTLVRDGSMCFIPVPFDPKPLFGKVRAPVTVTVNGYTYPSTIAAMGGLACIPLRRSNREAAGLDGTETLPVTVELDTSNREVEVPRDLLKALKAVAAAWERWRQLSYTRQREHVEAINGAKRPETRTRRIAAAVDMVTPKSSKPKTRATTRARSKAG